MTITDADREAAAILEALTPLADEAGRIARPIIDQWGVRVGTDYSLPSDIATVSALRDGVDGTVWTPPTADAYFQACTTINRLKADREAARREALEEAAKVAMSFYPNGGKNITNAPNLIPGQIAKTIRALIEKEPTNAQQ